jgi:hypothetical protein
MPAKTTQIRQKHAIRSNARARLPRTDCAIMLPERRASRHFPHPARIPPLDTVNEWPYVSSVDGPADSKSQAVQGGAFMTSAHPRAFGSPVEPAAGARALSRRTTSVRSRRAGGFHACARAVPSGAADD